MCRDLLGPSETYVFLIFHMENGWYIQYNSPIPILLPVSMNHLAERGQMPDPACAQAFSAPPVDKFSCRRFVNLLQTNLSAIDSQDIDGLHLKMAAINSLSAASSISSSGKSINGDRWGGVYPLRVGINNHINILRVSGGWMGIVGRHQIINRWSSCCY